MARATPTAAWPARPAHRNRPARRAPTARPATPGGSSAARRHAPTGRPSRPGHVRRPSSGPPPGPGSAAVPDSRTPRRNGDRTPRPLNPLPTSRAPWRSTQDTITIYRYRTSRAGRPQHEGQAGRDVGIRDRRGGHRLRPDDAGTRDCRAAAASGRALFYRHPEGLEQLVEVGERGVLRKRRHQIQQPLLGLVRRQHLEQMRPGRRPRGAVQVTRQVAAQLDGVPVLSRRGPAGPARRRPGCLRLVLGRGFGLEPLLGTGLPVRLQVAADLPLERVILARPVRPAVTVRSLACLASVESLTGRAGGGRAPVAG